MREFPKIPTWVYFAGFATLAIGVGVGFWAGGNPGSCAGLLAGFAAGFVLVVFFAPPLRCPQCKGSVLTREVEGENGLKRFFHDCPTCKISWRNQKRHFDSPDD